MHLILLSASYLNPEQGFRIGSKCQSKVDTARTASYNRVGDWRKICAARHDGPADSFEE
jgi:hypothetical protein